MQRSQRESAAPLVAMPDNNVLATGCRDGLMRLYDLRHAVPVAVILDGTDGQAGDDAAVKAVAFSSDGSWLASASMHGPRGAHLGHYRRGAGGHPPV